MLDLGSAVGHLLLDTQGFSSGFTSAIQAVRTMQNASSTAGDKFTSMGRALTSVGGSMTRSVTVPLVAIGTAAVHTAANFESSMSQVQATMGITTESMSDLNGESVNTMDALSALAQRLGSETKFSATEAAAAINNMAMAGYSTQEIYESLPQVLSLASAGALDLDYATQLVANGLNVMGMETSNAQELADKLAVTASNAYGSVSDFGEGLLVAGAQAKLANVSLTDTMTALGILGDNGISASEGGTYLRNTLKNLYTPTEDAAKALKELGVVTADQVTGDLRDFQSVLGDLGAALDGLTEEQRIQYMSRIFDARTISAANALIANSGERWDELSASIDNAGGAADRMAATQLDNLQGQLTILKSSIEGAAISFGELLLPVVKQAVDAFQGLMNWINGLDESQKKIVVTVLEVVAAIGPMLLILGKLSTAIGAIIGLFSGTGGLSTALSLLTGPLGWIILAVAALAAAWATDFMGIREVTAEVVGYIQEIIQSFLGAIQTMWATDLFGLRTTVEQFWESIKSAFGLALEAIRLLFKAFAAIFKGDWSSAWETIKQLGSTVWELIKTLFGAFLDGIVGLLVGIGAALHGAALAAWNLIKDGAMKAWEAVKSWFELAKEDPVKAIESIGTALMNAGKSIIDSLWEGLKSAWGAVSSWFEEKAAWISGVFSNVSAVFGGGGGGSYASGLDYITHDRVVQVHEGEAILTKEENRERRSNNNRSGGDTYNFYSPKALNPTTAAREMKKAKQQLALGVT